MYTFCCVSVNLFVRCLSQVTYMFTENSCVDNPQIPAQASADACEAK